MCAGWELPRTLGRAPRIRNGLVRPEPEIKHGIFTERRGEFSRCAATHICGGSFAASRRVHPFDFKPATIFREIHGKAAAGGSIDQEPRMSRVEAGESM